MKICIAVVVASFLVSIVMIAPATAQKDPACMEKCNRSNVVAGGGQQARGTAMLISLSLLGRSGALGARLKIRQHYSGPLAFGGNNSSSLGARLFRFTALGNSFTTSGVGIAVDRPTTMVAYDRKLSRSPLVLSYGKSRACGTGVSFPRTPDGRGCAP